MQPDQEAPDLGVADIARVLWRRKLSILLLGVLAAGIALGIDVGRTPLYEANAQLLLTPLVSQSVSSASGSSALETVDVVTAVRVISEASNEEAAAKVLKVSSLPVATVTEVGATRVVEISVRSPHAAFAARAANAYARAYIVQTRSQAVASIETAVTQVYSKIVSLNAQLASLQAQIDPPRGVAPSPAVISGLQAQEAAVLEEQTALREQDTNLQDNAGLTGGGGQLVGPARTPLTPASPHKMRDLAIGGVVGLGLGVAVALLGEFFDDRIRSEDDLGAAVGHLPILGLVPRVPEWFHKRDSKRTHSIPAAIAMSSPQSPAAEAFRSLRTSIQFLRLDQNVRTVVVTSPVSGEGKTTIVANLADSMAQIGQRVAVLSCDLRNPELHTAFGLSNEIGFTSVLLGEVTLLDALQVVPGYETLTFLAAGPIPPNPAELLSSGRCEHLLSELSGMADLVIIDSAPMLPVTDAVVLATRTDATILVVAAMKSTKSEVRRAISSLSRVDIQPLGVIVNRVVSGRNGFYYGYGYGYGYGRRVEADRES
jgi:capsular exopolysaccharide synthesis family protein